MKKTGGTWFALLTFCTTGAVLIASAFALAFTTASMAFAGAEPSADNPPRVFSGVITDAHCGAKHLGGKSPAECVRACIYNGSSYVLVDGDKVYSLVGSETDFSRYAGQRVAVAGTIDGNVITVANVNEPAPGNS